MFIIISRILSTVRVKEPLIHHYFPRIGFCDAVWPNSHGTGGNHLSSPNITIRVKRANFPKQTDNLFARLLLHQAGLGTIPYCYGRSIVALI